MEINFLAVLVAAIVPMVLGFIWYNPKFLGTVWAREAEMTETKMKSGNLPVIFGLSFMLSILLAFSIQTLTIHQFGALGMVGGDPTVEGVLPSFQAFMDDYGTAFRTYKHGAFHGILAGIFIVFPILATNGMFERKSWKLIFINSGYWTLALTIMGAIVCGWV
ncbi:DUF1761 domain-containing protein [Psychroserpens ponticola]|uniref:DUF1761 domain-containing protein n=1 Tax=Psychroserpens ponticola TaxID=2932268 RepID=A0ABY7RX07_9FLAO|nr:DUF1761 domain-containing protein [Psychroserpens ponticola]WCO01676.1 DUF1761 domain-containing protein [Psychroserpens ponticola]